jgi:type II secretory pathway component PulF
MSLFPFFGVSRKRRIAFYQQLEHLLDAGIPPIRSLETIAQQESSSKLRRVSLDMADHIKSGGSLSTAFDLHSDIFPILDRKMIKAGEAGGTVHTVISNIARFQGDLKHIWIRFWIDMIYPAMILFTAIVVCPLLKAMFLGGVEDLMTSLMWNAIRLVVWIFILIVGYRLLNRQSITRRIFHRIALRIPFFGKGIRNFNNAQFAKTFENLYIAGFSVFDAYRDSASACGNMVISERLLKSSHILKDGGNIAQTMSDTRLFTPIAIGMIATGEESGKLEAMLHKYAKFEQQEAESKFQRLGRIVPMLFYFSIMGFVAYMILSSYSNYFSLIQ